MFVCWVVGGWLCGSWVMVGGMVECGVVVSARVVMMDDRVVVLCKVCIGGSYNLHTLRECHMLQNYNNDGTSSTH